MLNLKTYFVNNFDDKEISYDELKKFTEDHLRRLVANNENDQYGDLIGALTTAYTDFFGDLSEADTAAAVREGLTLRVNTTKEAFFARVQRREGRIRDQWDKDSPEYQEFFPQGLSEYANATVGDAERLMNRFVGAAQAHIGKLGQAFHDDFFALRQAFTNARTAQLGKKGAVSSSQSDTKASRAALEKQLMTNLLLIAVKHIGEPGQSAVFFDQSIIRPQQSTKTETPTSSAQP